MSHTKGKWKIMPYTRRDGDNIRWVKAVRGKRHIPICQTFSPCAEANARLIATVPKLLEACEAWMKVESEMPKNNPCPDLALRAHYRKEAIALTVAAIAKGKKG